MAANSSLNLKSPPEEAGGWLHVGRVTDSGLLDAGAGVDGGAEDDGSDFAHLPVDLLLGHSQVLIFDGDVVRAGVLKVSDEFIVQGAKEGDPVAQVDAVGSDRDGTATVVAFDAVGKSMTKHLNSSAGFRSFA